MLRRTLVVALMLAAPRAAFACPVCFGDVTSPMAQAANMGIVVMLVVVACVLSAFASFFIYLARRARLVEGEAAAGGAGRQLLHVSNPDEGTVRC